jgi:hypothetical protein
MSSFRCSAFLALLADFRHPIFIFHLCTSIAQRQETRDELIYRFNLAVAKSEIMSKLSSPWILLLVAVLTSALISMAAATGSTEIFESRGIKSGNGGDENKPQKGIATGVGGVGGAIDIATPL